MPEKKPRPKVEDSANENLNGVELKTLLDFVSFLRENKMNPSYMARNTWVARYKGKIVCRIRINEGMVC